MQFYARNKDGALMCTSHPSNVQSSFSTRPIISTQTTASNSAASTDLGVDGKESDNLLPRDSSECLEYLTENPPESEPKTQIETTLENHFTPTISESINENYLDAQRNPEIIMLPFTDLFYMGEVERQQQHFLVLKDASTIPLAPLHSAHEPRLMLATVSSLSAGWKRQCSLQ